MKKNFWIGIISVLLGIVLAFQLKIVQKNFLNGMSPNQKSNEILAELTLVKAEKENLEEELASLEAKLNEIENSEAKENVLIQKLNDDIERLKLFSGFLDVKGEGIIITIDNPPEEIASAIERNLVYDYEYLLSLINELNAGGAEAISINEQRIVATSEIRAAGNAVNINKIPQSPPFVIKAVGNKDTLDGSINQRFGIVSIVRDSGYFVEVKKYDEVQIPKFNGVVRFKYAKTNE